MADTNHGQAAAPVQDDAVHFGGIGWFVVVLVGTVLVCQVFVWGLFKAMAWNVTRTEPARAALAVPAGKPAIGPEGQVLTGTAAEPAIPLNVTEPLVLKAFREKENATLDHYTWANKGAGQVGLPIERAKALLLERGLPVRAAAPAADATPAEAPKR